MPVTEKFPLPRTLFNGPIWILRMDAEGNLIHLYFRIRKQRHEPIRLHGEVFLMIKKEKLQPGSPGYSLIELLVLLAMIAILSGFAIPILSSSMRDMQLTADTRNIASSLNYARLKATSLMTPYQIQFDLDNNQWSVWKFDRATSSFQPEPMQDTNELSRGMASSGINFVATSSSHPGTFPTSSSTTVTFNTRGMPVNGTTPTADNIVYISRDNADYAITVSITGKVQIWKMKDSHWEAF